MRFRGETPPGLPTKRGTRPRRPPPIDIVQENEKKRTSLAIYEQQGDSLKLCGAKAGSPRPTEFSASKGTGHTLIIYKQVKTK
jgi:hypothetical protein